MTYCIGFGAPSGDVLPGISSKLGQSGFAKYHLDAGALRVAPGCKAAASLVTLVIEALQYNMRNITT
jgi:hypothetical protein